MYFQERVIFVTKLCEKEVWGRNLRLEMSWSLKCHQRDGPCLGFLPHQLAPDGASWGARSVPKPVEDNLGFAGGLISFQLGHWRSSQSRWQRWWEEAVAWFFRTHRVLSVWGLETCGKGWFCSPCSESPAVISCPSGEGRQLPSGRGWGMCSQHSDTLNKEAAGLIVSWEAAPFLRKTSGNT